MTVAFGLLVALAGPAAADPSDQPGGTSGTLDSSALDQLQKRAAEVQTGLQQRQAGITRAQQDLAAAQQQVDAAHAALDQTQGVLAQKHAVVAQYAAAAYRDGGTLTPLTVLLDGADPGDAITAMGYLDAVDKHTAVVVATAEQQRQAALDDQARAQAAQVTDELDRALGAVDSQLAQLPKQQLEVNQKTAANWQAYLDQLSAAGLAPPPAAALLDPASSLPAGLVPVAAHAGAADARAGAVVVRKLPADQVIGIGRPGLGQRAPVAAPGPTGGALKVECGNTVYPPSFDGARAWGGYPNGLIPPSALCEIGVGTHRLRCDAAAAYRATSAAFAGAFGTPICITDSYRGYDSPVKLYGEKPALAAVPGTSNPGWGLAVDLCGGIDAHGMPQYDWMLVNAGRFGWLHPTWADRGNGREEPWHWEYAGT